MSEGIKTKMILIGFVVGLMMVGSAIAVDRSLKEIRILKEQVQWSAMQVKDLKLQLQECAEGVQE